MLAEYKHICYNRLQSNPLLVHQLIFNLTPAVFVSFFFTPQNHVTTNVKNLCLQILIYYFEILFVKQLYMIHFLAHI